MGPDRGCSVERAAGLWRADLRGRTAGPLLTGANAAAPVWEWAHPPDDDHIARADVVRVDPADVAALLANQALYLDDRRLVVQYAESALRTGGPGLDPALVLDLHALAGKAYTRMHLKGTRSMRWIVHTVRELYRDRWVHLQAADVELPDGRHLDHRIIRTAAPGAGIVVVRDNNVLLIWRHRFITDAYGWEIPQGSTQAGETPADAAVREAEEETGWRPEGPIRSLLYSQPSPGIMTSEHHIFRADDASYTGPPTDAFESDKIDWVPLDDIRTLIDDRQIVAGTTLNALLYLLAERGGTGTMAT